MTSSKTETGYYTLCYDDYERTSSTVYDSPTEINNDDEKNDSEEEFNQINQKDFFYEDYLSSPKLYQRRFLTKNIKYDGIYSQQHEPIEKLTYSEFGQQINVSYSYQDMDEALHIEGDILNRQDDHIMVTEQDQVVPCQFAQCRSVVSNCNSPLDPYSSRIFDCDRNTPQPRTQSFSHSTPTSKSFVIDDSLADKKKLNSSCESFEFPGMTTDDLTSTINVNTDLTNLPQTHTDVTDKVEEFHFNEKDEDIARSGSSSGSLDMEIEKLRNISSSPVFFLGTHVSTLKRAKSCDDDLLDNPTSSRRQSQIRSRSSTPTGRKSPFDIFRKSRIQQFDSDGNITAKLTSKKKDNKQKKPADITRSSSPFMFRLKRSNSVSSKDKFKNQRKSKSLNDIKKDFMTSVTSDENEKTKLRQPSPFVRTVFQFVECAFDEDYLGINAFPTHTSDMIPVFSCGGIHTLSENHKTNSLSRRRKSKSLSQIPLHVIHPHAYEPTLVSSGRRIPENDDFIISVIAYLDRIRKAKQKPPIASKRRPRSKRNKSDPVAIAKFLQDLEVPSEDDGLGSASPNVAYQNTVKKSPYLPLTLHQRFTSCREYVFTASHDNEPQETCNSDPILHTISCNDLNKETQKEKKTNLMRKAKSLRSLILPTKKRLSQIKADECMSKNKSISSEIRSLCNLDSDMYTTKDNRHSTSSTDSSYNTSNDSINSRDSVASRNSGVDLVNFIRESKRHDENELQKFPISRSECQCEGREIRLDTDNPWLTQNILKELENSISTEYSSLSHSHTSNQNILSSQCLKTVNLLNKTSKDVFCEENQTELKNMDVVMNKNIYLNCRRSFNGDEVMLKPETKQSSHHDKSTKIGIKNKLKNKQQKRESDDVEYWTGSFGEDEQLIVKAVDHATNYSVIHKKGFLSGSFKRKSRKSSADLLEKRNNSVDLLEKHGEDSIEILDMASNENEKYKGNKKKLITHSSSWKKNRAPVNKPVPTEDTPMETKGTNRFSALLSIFEPSDKKKIKTTTSKVKNISPQELHVCDLANDCIVDEYEVSKTPSPKKKNHSLDININRKAFTPPVKRVSRNFIPVVVTHFTDNTKSEGRNKSRKTSGDQFSNAEEIILRNEPQKDITDRQQIKDIHLNDNTVKRLSFADPSSVVEKMIGNAESEGESSVEDNNEDKVEYNNKESQTLLRSTVDGEIVVDVPPDLLPSSNSNLRRHHVATKKIQHPVVKKKTTPTKRLSKSTSTDECFDIDTVIKHTGFRTTSQNSNGCFVVESEQQDFNNNHLTKPVLDVPKCLEKEKNTPEDFNIDSDYEDVDDEIDYGSIPSIPRPELLLEESHRNTLSLSNSCQSAVYSPSYHYKSYSAMASSLFQDIYGPPLTPKGFGTLPLNSVRLDTPTTKSKVSPPVKPKPKLGVVLNKQKSMSPNIAMVSPFNKNEVHESADDITVSRKAFEHPANNNSLKRSNTVSEIGEAFEKALTKDSRKTGLSLRKSVEELPLHHSNESNLREKTDNNTASIKSTTHVSVRSSEANMNKDYSKMYNSDSETEKTHKENDPLGTMKRRNHSNQSATVKRKTFNLTKGLSLTTPGNDKKSIKNQENIVNTDTQSAKSPTSFKKTFSPPSKFSSLLMNKKSPTLSLKSLSKPNKKSNTLKKVNPMDANNNNGENSSAYDDEDASNEFNFVSYSKSINKKKSLSQPSNLNSTNSNDGIISYHDDEILDGYSTLKKRLKSKSQKLHHNDSYFESDVESDNTLRRRTASPTAERRNTSFNDAIKNKHRCNSTGHSPDFTQLLHHLICDIEEEVSDDDLGITSAKSFSSSSVEEPKFKQQQLESFNSNLKDVVSYSADSISSFNSEVRKSGRLRKTLSQDDVGLKSIKNDAKEQRRITSGEKPLKRTPSVIWARVKHMDVSLVIDSDFKKNEIIHIDSFDVRRANTYKDVEDLAVDTFIKHLQLLDKQTLDLRKDDIQFLRLAEHKVAIGTSFDLSFVRIQDGHLPCQLYINGKDSWSLAAIAYDTLIPKSILEKYLSLILSHQNIMFYGPSGTGKSYIARRLAMFISHRMNEGSIAPMILKNVTPDKWKYLIENLDSEKREFPFVIFLDGFSQSFINTGTDICDLIAICEKLNPPPYIICAVTQIPDKDIPAPWQLGFKWIWLPNHEEPIDGILQRFLRRKFIQHGNVHLQRESFRIADWLSDVWKHINTLIEKFNSTEATLGPTMFYTCPSDILLAEEWFVDLWNYSITPYFLLTVKQGLKLYGQRREWDDPLEWILKSYPWVSEKSRRKMKLRRIRMEDVGYQMNSSTAYSSVESQSEQERLLDFLRQLETLMRDSGSVDLSQFQSKSNVLESSI